MRSVSVSALNSREAQSEYFESNREKDAGLEKYYDGRSVMPDKRGKGVRFGNDQNLLTSVSLVSICGGGYRPQEVVMVDQGKTVMLRSLIVPLGP